MRKCENAMYKYCDGSTEPMLQARTHINVRVIWVSQIKQLLKYKQVASIFTLLSLAGLWRYHINLQI